MRKCFIVDALFVNFVAEGDGSVINLENVELTILCSVFKENTATQNGGSIYVSNSNFNISKSTFFHCQSSAGTNDISGNAIYQTEGTSLLKDMSILLCAKSREIFSDSSVKLFATLAKCTQMNLTSNHGSGGASGLAIWKTHQESLVSYINVYDVLDTYSMEANYNYYRIMSSNFMKFNLEYNANIVYTSNDNLLSFTNCCFFETCGLSFAYKNRIVVFTDCIMGEKSSSFTYASSITLVPISLNLQCQPIHRTCNKIQHINNAFLKLPFFIIFIK